MITAVDWEKLLTVDYGKAVELFTSQAAYTDSKLQIRGYTIPFSGTQQRFDSLMQFLRRQLLRYVFPEKERPDDIDWAVARDKFGDNDPASDGKLGEMLLYVFVEAFLKTPLMAYKLKDLGNPNDQVKGADAVFVGEYNGQPALLIGESKIHQKLSSAINRAIESLQRFHERSGPYANELLIARKYPSERGLSADALDSAYAIIGGNTGVLVHPVFVSYDFSQIPAISRQATDCALAEKALKQKLMHEIAQWKEAIESLGEKFPKPFQVFLDFFFLPVEDSMQLRNHFYEMLHGHPYESAAVRGAVKKVKQEIKKAESKGDNG